MKLLRYLAFAMPAMTLAACATTEVETEETSKPLEERTEAELSLDYTCLRNESISGFVTIDDEHVLVHAPSRSRTYLLTTVGRCLDLRFANNIKVESALSCVTKLDKIRVIDNHATPVSCMIKFIDRVEDKEAAMALIALRQNDKSDDSDSAEPE